MPLVYEWLKHAEATRRLIKENYQHLEGEELLKITVAENVLNQLENLHTYPIIRSKLHQNNLSLHGWIYRIETGEVLAYDSVLHDFVAPHSRLPSPEYEYNLHPACPIPSQTSFTVPQTYPLPKSPAVATVDMSHLPGASHLPIEQSQRIYRGSV